MRSSAMIPPARFTHIASTPCRNDDTRSLGHDRAAWRNTRSVEAPHRRSTPRGLVAGLSVTLVIGTLAVLMATNDMGYTRDESFYFRYARQYADWFHALEQAEDAEEARSVLSRGRVVKAWLGNFEHPPLMKSAFGSAWRHLARKDRRAIVDSRGATREAPPRVRVTGLAAPDGFEVDARVDVLAPLALGQSPTDPARWLAQGVVVERRSHDAIVVVAETTSETFASCRADALATAMTGCQGREVRAMARFDEATAMRVPAMLTTVLAVLFTFLLGVKTVGWFGGLFGATAFLFVPRHFFHGHLIAFDMAIVAAMMATLYAFWRARTDRRWALVTGVAWGVALLVKHNAFFLPVPLLAFWLWTGRGSGGLQLKLRPLSLRLPPLPLALLVMPVVAFPMLFVLWPKLWFDPYRAVADYFQFHLRHDHYMQWFFGQPLEVPPFPVSFPFVMSAWTLPEVFSVLIVGGAVVWWLRVRRGDACGDSLAFLLFNGLAPVLLIALPSTPIFGGVKHWMTGMPLLLLVAGYGFERLVTATVGQLPGRGGRTLAIVGLFAMVFAGPVHASIRSAPFGTAYYNSLVGGGARGAADAQLHRLYWGHTSRQALGWLNEHAPTGARVFFQNTTRDAYEMYRRVGLLRHDIRYHGSEVGAAVALIEPQKSFDELDRRVREEFGVNGPVETVRYQGVPMLRVYQRSSAPAASMKRVVR